MILRQGLWFTSLIWSGDCDRRTDQKTQNKRVDAVDRLGENRLEKIYDLADVYHSDNIERVSDDFIKESGIEKGNFDNVKECGYAIPSHWDIGKVYKRLIKGVAEAENIGIIEALWNVYHSFISEKLMIITAVCITKIHLICWNVI